jgi:hypothetical protein
LKKYTLFLFLIFSLYGNNLVEITLPNDQWKLIGVPGPFYEGSGSSDSFTSGWYRSKDTTTTNFVALSDASYTVTTCDTSSHVSCFSLFSNSTIEQINFASDVNNSDIDLTLPRRYMFLDLDDDGNIDVKISYQADLEGEAFEIEMIEVDASDGTIYEGTYNSAYGYENPATLSAKSGTSTTYSLTIREILDMNFSNNPGHSGQSGDILDFESGDVDTLVSGSGDYVKIFKLNSSAGYWKIFDSRYDDSYNDFTEFTPGYGYWVYLHDDTEDTTKHGFILGDGNITADSYTSLDDGWNMLSFPDGFLRYSGTGLRLEINGSFTATTKEFLLTDEVGQEKLYIKVYDVDDDNDTTIDSYDLAVSVNMAIASAIEEGNVSKDFNIRAIPTGTDSFVVFLSDKKFRIYEKDRGGNNDEFFSNSTTIGDNNPYDLSSSTYSAITNLDENGIASRYGEYSLVVAIPNDGSENLTGLLEDPTTDAGKIQINSNNILDFHSHDDMSDLDTEFEVDDDIDSDFKLDIDFNDNIDSYLIANTSSPFYIKDYTFVKTYRVDDRTYSSATTIYLFDGNETYNSISISTAENTPSEIASQVDRTSNFNAYSSGNYIYVYTTNANYRNFDLLDSSDDDIFTRVNSSSNALSKGAIKEVYSLSDLGRADVNKSVFKLTIYTPHGGIEASDELNISIDENITNTKGSHVSALYSDTNATALCETVATRINTYSEKSVYAECNSSDANSSTLTLTGYFSEAGYKCNDAETDNNLSVNGLSWATCNGFGAYKYYSSWDFASIGGVPQPETLTDDLTYKPIYSPDFPGGDSVLQYVRSNNCIVEKLLTAVDDGDSSISWKYLDLTVDAEDWFEGFYDHDIFSTEEERGYFTYLDCSQANSMTLEASLDLEFRQNYNSDDDSDDGNNSTYEMVQNFPYGTLYVEVTNDEGENTEVIATIQGEDYKLLEGNSAYSLEISMENLPTLYMADSTITITAYDEKGQTATDTVELNLSSPGKPKYRFFDDGGHLFLGSTSSDVASFNIYSGYVDNRYPVPSSSGSNYVNTITEENDHKTCSTAYCEVYLGNSSNELEFNSLGTYTYVYDTSYDISDYADDSFGQIEGDDGNVTYFLSYNICADAPDFDTNNSGWLVTAVDGDGDVENSRVSDIKNLPDWYPIYYNASILEALTNSTTDLTPRVYDTDCEYDNSSELTTDNGVILELNTSGDTNVTLAYDTVSSASINQAPPSQIATAYISYGDNNISQIQFYSYKYVYSLNSDLGSEKTLLVELNDTAIYQITFDDLYDASEDSNQTLEIRSVGKELEAQFNIIKDW